MKPTTSSKVGKSWYMPNVLKKIDIFGQPLPTFNLKGETAIPTLTGGIVTFLILIVFLAYSCLKFLHLINKHNPTIIENTEKDVFGSDDLINLDDIGFHFAFTTENY